MRFPRRPALPLLSLLLAVAAAGPAAAEDDPWALLDGARAGLEADSPLRAVFTQQYRPAGFSSAESEEGELALALPACLRWDYREPFPRSYLLCGDTAWAWNDGESSGRRYLLAARDQPGLDLLRLRVDELRRRYRAELLAHAGEGARIRLTPLEPGPVSEAWLTLDTAARRISSLGYDDAEGNATRFDFDAYGPLGPEVRFEPPDLEWLDE